MDETILSKVKTFIRSRVRPKFGHTGNYNMRGNDVSVTTGRVDKKKRLDRGYKSTQVIMRYEGSKARPSGDTWNVLREATKRKTTMLKWKP